MRAFIELVKENRAALRKFFVALATALAMLGTVWSDGILTGQDWIVVSLAFLSALGVYSFPNDPMKARGI